ncbi:hypothetical protein D3C71_1747360 [compost metagenome]
MYAAVILFGLNIVLHAGRLRVFPQQRIVVSRTGGRHGTQALAVDAFRQQSLANQPVGFIRGLFEVELFNQRTKHVGQRLIQRTSLLEVN